jgi:hypothetical protein
VATDPADATNHVLSVVTKSTHLHKGTSIPDGSTAMFFLRFRIAEHLSASFGLSDVVGPDRRGVGERVREDWRRERRRRAQS